MVDTVSDPLKEISGPTLNPMIIVVNLVSLTIAPIIVRERGINWVTIIVVLMLVALLGWAKYVQLK